VTEEQAKCCGNCWWWIKYRSREGGWCYRDGSDRLPSDSCWQWESYCTTLDKSHPIGPPGKLEEDDNDA
jgi:hypothetical protein